MEQKIETCNNKLVIQATWQMRYYKDINGTLHPAGHYCSNCKEHALYDKIQDEWNEILSDYCPTECVLK